MLTPGYLEALPGPILELYEEYTQSILNDIARRLKNGNFASAAWQMQRLTESSLVYQNAIKEIARLSGKTQKELKSIFQEAGVKTIKFDDAIYKAAGLNPLPLNMSPAMVQVLRAGLNKTGWIMTNLTSTTALASQRLFLETSDLAYMQVVNGALDYNTAIKRAIHTMSQKGIDAVDYISGHSNAIDVAMRRVVLTGVSQTAAKLQDTRADEMGVNLVQTSAHGGARPSHMLWQGKIFMRVGSNSKYPNFIEATGYGTGAGLCGWNCRHSWFPFFEGISENAYSKAMLNEMNNRQVTYNGIRMSDYEASQIQRKFETQIRNSKREVGMLRAIGESSEKSLRRISMFQAKLRDLTRQTGLDRQYVREGGRI